MSSSFFSGAAALDPAVLLLPAGLSLLAWAWSYSTSVISEAGFSAGAPPASPPEGPAALLPAGLSLLAWA